MRMAQAIKQPTDTQEQIEKLEQKIQELKEERIKLQTVNIERNRVDRTNVRQELFYEYVGSVITTLPLPDFKPIPDFSEELFSEEYLVALSDTHYGAKFVSENNSYSPEIAKQRLEDLTGQLITFIQSKKLKKLKIVFNGDSLQGLLRLSDIRLNDSTVVKSCVDFSRLMALMLNELSIYTEIDYYHVPTANHTQTRPLGTKASELPGEDLEYLIGNYIKDLCSSNNRIKVNLAGEGKSYLSFNIHNFEIVAMHGHQIKNLQTALKDLSSLKHKFIDYLVLGHYHANAQIPSNETINIDTEILVAPSFVGSDPYSDSLFKGSKSSVAIYGFHELFGHNETYKIILN